MSDQGPSLGVLAFGDSITNAGWQFNWSWAVIVARCLGLPYTGYAVDGARVRDVVRAQIPAFKRGNADPAATYDLGCLYIGINDVVRDDFDPDAFAADFAVGLDFLTTRCRRTLTMLAPLQLGRPRADGVVALNRAIEEVARERGALTTDLRDLHSRELIMPDRIHPTPAGQLELAERALATLAVDGLATRMPPSELISYRNSWRGRIRQDLIQACRTGGRRLASLHAAGARGRP